MLRLPMLIQQETRLVKLAEAMAEGAHLEPDAGSSAETSNIPPGSRVEAA